jgi:hypothetical protein
VLSSYEKQPFEQHHIYPQALFWFFKKLDINIDSAENIMLVPKAWHTETHVEGWNPVWAASIRNLIDPVKFNETEQKIEFRNPLTGQPTSDAMVRLLVIAAGESEKFGLKLLGFGESPVEYLGPNRKNPIPPAKHKDIQ